MTNYEILKHRSQFARTLVRACGIALIGGALAYAQQSPPATLPAFFSASGGLPGEILQIPATSDIYISYLCPGLQHIFRLLLLGVR